MDFTAVITAEKLPLLAFTIATLIGLVNAIQLSFPKVTGVYGVMLAVGFGLLGGFLHLFGLTPEIGLVAGFASSGIYKLAQKQGGN